MKKISALSSPGFLLSGLILLSLSARAISLFTPEVWIDEGTVGLMSLHVMEGEFPLFFYGQKFMGAMEAYLYGLFFHIFGSSPFTLELLPSLLSLLFVLLTYRLAQKLFGHKTALMSGLFLALPPYFLMFWTHEGRLHYSLVLLLGSLLLLIAHQILQETSSPNGNATKLFILLGLIGGLGWWTNYLIVIYLLTVSLIIVFHQRKILLSKTPLLVLFFFGLGSLPLWIFNFTHQSSILAVWGSTHFSWAGLPSKLKALFSNALPIILGFFTPFSNSIFELAGYIFLLIIYLGAFCYLAFYCWRSFAFISSKTKGAELLLFLLLFTVLFDLFSGYGLWLNEPCQRYLLPMYSAIPIMAGFFLIRLRSKYRLISLLLTLIVLLFNLWGNLIHPDHFFRWKDDQPIYNGWKIFNPAALKRYRENQQKENRLMDFLKSKGYKTIYGEECFRKKLTFQSNETLIFSDPYQEIYLKYVDMVDGGDKTAYLFKRENTIFEKNLKALGGTYQKFQSDDGYFVYSEFFPPKEGSRLVPRQSWRGITTMNGSQASKAFDGHIITGWRSEHPQQRGDFFMLDLGEKEKIHKISWIPENYREVPLGYQVAVSVDGRTWEFVADVPDYRGPFFWSGPHPMVKIRMGRIEAVFPSVSARYVKIILTGQDAVRHWSINELFLFAPENGEKSSSLNAEEMNRLIHFLFTNRIDFIYADHWLSARIRSQSDWRIRSLVTNHYLDNNGEKMPRPGFFTPVMVNSRTGFLVENTFLSTLEETLKALPSSYKTKSFGPLTLFYNVIAPDKMDKNFSNYYWAGNQLLKR